MEGASGGQVEGAGDFPFYVMECLDNARIWVGDRCDKDFCVGVVWIFKNGLCGAVFHNFAQVHNVHVTAVLGNNS